MDSLRFALRSLALTVLGVAGLGAAAQDPGAAWALAEPLAPGAVLYTADDIGEVEVATALFLVGEDGKTAAALPSHACAPQCMVFAVRVSDVGGAFAPSAAEREPGSWLVVLTRAGTRVEVDGALVARANARIRVPPGDHEITFRFENGEVRSQTQTVAVATEVTVAQLPSRNAPPPAAETPVGSPAVVVALTIPMELLAGLLDGAESRPDDPAAGWRLPEPEPEPVPPRPPVAARTPPPRPAPRPEPPPVEPAPSREVQPATDPACDVAVADLSATAMARTRAAEYPAARACLLRLTAEGGDRVAVLMRLSALDRAIALQAGLGDASRQWLHTLRLQAASAAERAATASLLDAAAEVLRILPGDPSAVAYLQDIARAAPPPEGGEAPGPTFVFVPGPLAARTATHLVPAGVPEVGYLLTRTEVSNAQFVAFLNSLADVDRTYLVRRPEHIVPARQGMWQPTEGAAELPVVDATWYGAAAYAAWAGGRLPTSAEWIWAYQTGMDTADSIDPNLNDGTSRTALVGVADGRPDGLGLVHMLGNVWEWLASDEARPAQVSVAGGSHTTRHNTLVGGLTQRIVPEAPRNHVGFRVFRPLSK